MGNAVSSLAAWAQRVVSDVLALLHRNDDIPLFVPLVHIPVGLDDLLQGIASINDWFDLARFHQFFEVHELLRLWGCFPSDEGLAAGHPRKTHAQTQCRRSKRLQIDSIWLQH